MDEHDGFADPDAPPNPPPSLLAVAHFFGVAVFLVAAVFLLALVEVVYWLVIP